MTCHDARERLSDLLDDAIEPGPRALVDAHLAGCAECRRELERLRATVSLLHRVEAPRAPVDFVDRVMRRATPAPWYRRVGARLFLPLTVKLPAEAAAMVLIAVLVVYLWERTPELRDAARTEPVAPVAPSPAPAPTPAPAAPAVVPAPAAPAAVSAPAAPAPASPRAAEPSAPAVSAPASPSSPLKAESPAATAASAGNLAQDTKEAQPREAPLSARSAPAPPVAAQAESQHTALRQGPASSVVGRLTVGDRVAADRSLAELIARVGGSEAGRRQDGDGALVDVLVPEPRYDEFVRGLEALGAWTAEGRPAALPLNPPQIRITVHIR